MKNPIKTLVDASSGLKFTESPRWYGDKLWFLDIHDQSVKTVDLTGKLETKLVLPFIPNGFGFAPEGDIIVGDAFKRHLVRSRRGDLQTYADIGDITRFCLSDGIVDAKGRLYIGDIGYNFLDKTAKPVDSCVIVRVDPDGQAFVVAEGMSFPNGMVIDPEGRQLIVAETIGHRLTAFDIESDGGLSKRRLWAQLPEGISPDGICLDAANGVWCANPEGKDSVVRVEEGGRISDRIQLSTHAYAVGLGGPERKQLFICASDSHDPEHLKQHPSATLRVVDVEIPGVGIP